MLSLGFRPWFPVRFATRFATRGRNAARDRIILSKKRGTRYIPQMSGIVVILLFVAMIATVAVLVVGVTAMARGGEFNRRYSNKLMRARIVLQAIALLLFAIIVFFIGRN